MLATIEIGHSGNAELIAEVSAESASLNRISINEISQLKISVIGANTSTRVFAGLMQLKGFLDPRNEKAYFARSDIQLDNLEKNSFFSAIFVNQVGASQITIEHNGQTHSIFADIESTKVDDEELHNWIQTITEEFPLFKLPNLMTPLTTISARSSRQDGFRSLYSFIVDANQILDEIEKKVTSGKYLQRSYHRFVNLNGAQISKKNFTDLGWVKPGNRWKPTHASNNSVVRKGLMSFEPEKYPGLTGNETFQNELNNHLHLRLATLSNTCRKHLTELKDSAFQIENLRTQFGERTSKLNLYSKYEDEILLIRKKSDELTKKLEDIGVSGKVKTHRFSFDNRYAAICRDIVLLDNIISQLFHYTINADFKLGLLGLDFIFEYFALASIMRELRAVGFEVVDATATTPVNNYISLKHTATGHGVRVFFDQHVPKAAEEKQNFPLWDYWPGNVKLCPDFILHFHADDYEEVVVLDAKYKTMKKCESDLNSFHKQQSILIKYGTKMFLAGETKTCPVYIGALCLADDQNKGLAHKWLLTSNLNDQTLSQEVGITSLHSSSNKPLRQLLSQLWGQFTKKAATKPGHIISELTRPDVFEVSDRKIKKKYSARLPVSLGYTVLADINRNISPEDRAPSLTAIDARLIKGMLARGDVPQHITQYFGVNPGRISDIKNGKTFLEEVPSKKEDLPFSGPYPSIKELLEIFPEISKILK